MLPHSPSAPPDDELDDFHAWLADIPTDATAFAPAVRPAAAVDLTAQRTSPRIRRALVITATLGFALGLLTAGPIASHILRPATHPPVVSHSRDLALPANPAVTLTPTILFSPQPAPEATSPCKACR